MIAKKGLEIKECVFSTCQHFCALILHNSSVHFIFYKLSELQYYNRFAIYTYTHI